MPLLTLANIHHAYGSEIVLDGLGFSIEPGQKVGLVGRNGCGKTTLMNVIRGVIRPDSGDVQLMKSSRVGYLSQDPAFDQADTVRDAAERAFEELHALHVELHEIFERMSDAEGDALERLLRRQVEMEARIEAAGGYAIDHRIEATLHGLGFVDDQFSLNVSSLSGGQKNRLGLARLLLEAPDLLLLDEPTNHLDIAGCEWLESFLREEYQGAVLVVSHDRRLLDRVVSRIIEVERGVARVYPGNYEKFIALRHERMLTESRVYEKQLDHIRAEQRFIDRYKAGQRAKQARGRQSRLQRFRQDELVTRPIELQTMKLRLPKIERSGDIVIVAEHLSKQYDDLVLFNDLNLTISRGERVGIIGPNGIGKTTLVRCLVGDLESSAGVGRLGARVNAGYYRQTQEHLDADLTVWQYLQKAIVSPTGEAKASEQQARDLAGAFLFSGDEQDKTLGLLSGGERSRTVLAGLVGSAHNLLILDEPTNHLDIPSAERLEDALASDGGYQGTLMIITHDRAFLDATCTRLLVFEGEGRVTDFPGTYSEWKLFATRRDREANPRRAAAEKTANAPKARRQAAAHAREEQRQGQSELERVNLSQLEARIEKIERRVREIDECMLDPNMYADGERCRVLQQERAALHKELEPLEFEWSRRADTSR